MFKKMQLKLTIYYSVILIAAIFSMSALLYFFVYEFSSQNLLSDVKSDLDAITESDWREKPTEVVGGETQEQEDTSTETTNDDSSGHANSKDEDVDNDNSEDNDSHVNADDNSNNENENESDQVTLSTQANIEKVPSLLGHFSAYKVMDADGNTLFEANLPSQSKESSLFLESMITSMSMPQFIRDPNLEESVYIGYKSPIYLNGEVRGSFVILQDVTQTFKTLDDLLKILMMFGGTGSILAIALGYVIAGRAIKPVSEAYHQKQIFLENVSHEMRTPLSAILLNTELLELGESSMTAEKQESYEAIKKEVSDLRNQISELLNKERVPQFSKRHHFTNINMSKVLESEVNRFRIIAADHKITLKTHIQPDLYIYAQERDLVNVFRVLIDNAIKYSFENGHVEIVLSQKSRLDREILFQLTDYGCGIEANELSSIFKRDYRAASKLNQPKEGYGLGLSIVEAILTKMQAKIEVNSKVGEGTTFRIVFSKS